MSTPLTDSINALTTYANEVTGASDTTLSDAVYTLASGYGGGSGLEYETGTYTAASDGNPTINFTNIHASAPALVIFMDTGSYINQIGGISYEYIGLKSLFGSGLKVSATVERDAKYGYSRIGSTGSPAYGGAAISTISDHVTNTGFTPNFNSANIMCKAGRTYKWIAIWVPTS